MIRELDLVVLTRPIAKHGLKEGDVGTVVHCYEDHQAYEVEFVDADGSTIAVLTLEHSEIRTPVRGEILHVRELSPTVH